MSVEPSSATGRPAWQSRTVRHPFHVDASPATRERHWKLRASRAIDVAFAMALVCLLALPMLALSLLIKLTSRGPVMYAQERVGLGGRVFFMYKFRTMAPDAEAQSGPIWATPGDPRRTLLGGFLRRFSLDELPQFFNVLKGDMSLVGPRPERPFFVREFCQKLPAYNQRHQVRPGITGWAQVNGWRGDTSLERRLEHDLYYVNHWSLWFNLRILVLTPLRAILDKNAC